MPDPSAVPAVSGTRQNQAEPLPELPTIGAMASKSVLSSHGHDELFGHGQAAINPLPIEEIPVAGDQDPFTFTDTADTSPPGETGIPGFTPATKPVLDVPHLPRVDEPFAETANIAGEETGGPDEIPAMDIPAVSKIQSGPDIPPQETKPVVATSSERVPQDAARATPAPEEQTPVTPSYQDQEFTDKDLEEALRPLIELNIDQFLYKPSHGIHSYLEPMLRSTVRRAIAEQMRDSSPFRDVSGWDKFAWKLRALMSSRTYEDILFDYTRRYQVEEVFLLRPKTRSLISYASHDPSRHAKPGKVEGTVKKIATKIAHKAANDSSPVKWENNNRHLLIRHGKYCTMAAIVHGAPNAVLRADLDYALRQAEDRFGKTLEENSDIHLHILQPLLEGCLLIQSVAVPN